MKRKLLLPGGIALVLVTAVAVWMFLSAGPRRRPLGLDGLGLGADRTGSAPIPGAEDPVDGTPAEGAADAAALASQGALGAAGSVLSGKVETRDGYPLPGAAVLVLGATTSDRPDADFREQIRERLLGKAGLSERARIAETETGSDGRYRIEAGGIPLGTYLVLVRKEGASTGREGWTHQGESQTLDFVLDLGITLEGVVVSPEGAPVAGAQVDALDDEPTRRRGGFGGFGGGPGGGPGGGGRALIDRTLTNSQGHFFLHVAEGQYRLQANASGYSLGELDDIVAPTLDSLVIQLAPARRLVAHVVGAQGQPIEGAQVSLISADGGPGGPGFGERGGFGRGGFGRGGDIGNSQTARMAKLFRDPQARGATDASGSLEFGELGPGTYLLLAEKPGHVSAAAAVELSEEAHEGSAELAMADAAVLTGTITGLGGDPVPGAMVLLSEAPAEDPGAGRGGPGNADAGGNSPGGNDPANGGRGRGRGGPGRGGRGSDRMRALLGNLAAAQTDAKGVFRIDTVAPGSYALDVDAEQFLPPAQQKIELETELDVAVTLDPGTLLAGRVVDASGDDPVPKARVRLRLGGERRDALTDTDGRFSLSGLDSGTIDDIEVEARGFPRFVEDGLELVAGEAPPELTIRLDPPAVLSGTVTDKSGQPVADVRVGVAPPPPEDPSPQPGVQGGDQQPDFRARFQTFRRNAALSVRLQTGPDGRFKTTEAPPGVPLVLTLEHRSFKPLRSDPVVLPQDGSSTDLKLVLLSGAEVVLTVQDSTGAPLGGVGVRLTQEPEVVADNTGAGPGGQDGPGGRGGPGGFGRGGRGGGRGTWSREIATDSQGQAVFKGLEGGAYILSIAARGHEPYVQKLQAVEEQSVPVAVRLLPEHNIAGTVTDSMGAAVPDARIVVWKREEVTGNQQTGQARSQESGAFRVGSLAQGAYSLRVTHEGFADFTREGVETDYPVDVKLTRLGAIAGWVLVAESALPLSSYRLQTRPEARGRAGAGGDGTAGDVAAGGGGRGGFGQGGPGGGPGGRGGPGGGFGRGGFGGVRPLDVNDPTGAFLVKDLVPGRYVLQVSAEGYTGAEATVNVEEGLTTEGVRLEVHEGMVLAGTAVEKETGLLIPGAEVLLLPVAEDPAVAAERGQDAGADARASAQDRRDARNQARQDRNDRGGSRGSSARDLATAELLATALKSAQTGGRSLGTTDEAGAFLVRDIAEGRYLLLAQHEAYVPGIQELRISADVFPPVVTLRLSRGETLEGKVVGADGSPAVGATVTLRDGRGLSKRVQADERGAYLLQGLSIGTYTLSVRSGAQGASAVSSEVKVESGQNQKDIDLSSGSRR